MQLHRARKDIEAAGARLVFIGQATPRHAQHFRRRFAPDIPILADEQRVSYRKAGAVRGGAAELLGPGVILKGIGRSARNRTVQGRPIGDVKQLGGTLIVMPDGSIPWSHMSRDAADNPSIDELLEGLTAAAGT
jgi:hypothetical protein